MKKIAFIVLYDMICSGTRLLASLAQENGVEPHLIILKEESSYKPIWKDRNNYQTYQFYYNGLLRGSHYATDPVSEKEIELLISTLGEISPDAICLSTRTFAYGLCKDIFPRIKKALPNTPVLAGGWGPTLEPEKFLEFSEYVGFGEGEQTIVELCQALKGERPINSLSNLIYRSNGRLVRNEIAKPLGAKDLDRLPFPDFSVKNKYLISNNLIRRGNEFYNEKVYDCFAARGCPLNCTYCMSSKYQSLYENNSQHTCSKYRLRDIDVVIDEVRRAVEKGAEFIRFKDEVFPIHPKWIEEFFERYPREIGLPFFGFVRPEFHSPEIIKKLASVGLCVTMVGIQSGSARVLEEVYHRKLSKDKIINFATTLADLGIQFSYHFIYCNPLENEADLEETFEFAGHLPPAPAFIFKLEVFPGSPISRMIEQEKPTLLPRKVSDWYAALHSMAIRGGLYGRLARFIHGTGLFKGAPRLMALLFLPSLTKEVGNVLKNKYLYNAKLHFSPKTK